MKRLFDIVFSTIGLLILSPILFFFILLIRKKIGSPIFFCQDRPGLNGKNFKLVKFRTMNYKKDLDGNLLEDSQRLTSFGKWLRKTSIDEIPELWNVLKGDMSIVGPRPLLTEYLPLYNEQQKKRHDVLPGITGWAQVNGRNNIPWDKRLELDIWYVKNRSFLIDLKIILMTVVKVISRKDISARGQATVSRFKGTKK